MPTDSSVSLSVTPAVSSSVIVSVTLLTARFPAVAVRTRLSSSSSTKSSTMLTSAVAEISPTEIVN